MLRNLRNLIINIMAAFIRDRDARHKFRDKYKRKSKFRKLRDDNRVLFKQNAVLKAEIQEIKNDLNSIKAQNYFVYSPIVVTTYKNFFLQIDGEELIEKYNNLIKGLDNDSIKCVSQILSRAKLISEQDPEKVGAIDIFTSEEKLQIDKVKKEFHQQIIKLSNECWAYRQYIFPISKPEVTSLYYKHQIDHLKNIDGLKEKDFLDVGCYIGDSAVAFTEFTKGKIYSFEPVSAFYDLTLKTIEMNGCTNIIPINIALGSKDENMTIHINGVGSSLTMNTTGYRQNSKTEIIKVTTLDNFVKGKNIDIGLIKVDIEGFEQEFLKGAEQTIRKYKPTLLISIYHNASDFFNIKPIIESWDLGYSFKISHPITGGLMAETLLICEQ